MKRIVICEDSPKQLAHFNQCVSNYIMIEELDLNIELQTHDPYQVIQYLESQPHGETLYFLDIDLSTDITGMDLAQKIRQVDDLSKIVFITTLSETMPLVFRYKLEVLDFIVKDDFDKIDPQIRKCIDTALDRQLLNKENKQIFTANLGRRTRVVDYDDIYYFQTAENHKVILVGRDVYFEYYDKLSDIIETTQFTQVHRSYVANLKNVETYDHSGKEIHFPDDLVIPVGRSYQKNVADLLKKIKK